MTDHRTLILSSMTSVVLFSLHWADEIARGIERGTIDSTWGGFAILFVWLYGTLAIGERRPGLVIMLVGGLLAAVVPVLHMQGNGVVGGRIPVGSSGALFWVWTNIALGASGWLSLALATRGLWNFKSRRTTITA
jgi:hypothetical protein